METFVCWFLFDDSDYDWSVGDKPMTLIETLSATFLAFRDAMKTSPRYNDYQHRNYGQVDAVFSLKLKAKNGIHLTIIAVLVIVISR